MTARRGLARSVFVFVLPFGLLACESASAPLAQGLRIEPSTIDLGRVALGDSRRGTVVLRNDGDAPIRLGALDRVSGLDRDVAFVLSARELAVGASAELFVDFAPTTPGLVEGVLGFSVEGEVELRRVPVRGEGFVPTIAVASPRVALGRVVRGASARAEVTVVNGGPDRVVVSVDDASAVRPCVEGGAPCVDGAADLPLAGGASVGVPILFAPSVDDEGEVRRTLVLSTCALPECRVEVVLEGVALTTALECPSRIDLGLSAASGCAREPVACVNVASHEVAVARWRFDAASSAAFEVTPSTPTTLAPGASLALDVTYCPAGVGPDRAVLVVEPTLGDDPHVALSGEGLGPDLVATPPAVDFGLVSLIAPARRTVHLRNLGDAPIIVADVHTTSPAFSVLSSVGVIAPGEAFAVIVEALPFVTGVVEAELVVAADGDISELHVPLSAEGVDLPPCALDVLPELGFGAVEVGREARVVLPLQNAGTTECIVNEVVLDAGSDPAFSALAPSSQRLAGGATALVDLSFAPLTEGDAHALLRITVSSPTRPFVEVALSGRGVIAASSVFPSAIDFGGRAAGCAAPVRRVWITSGAEPFLVTSITLTPGAFTLEALPVLPLTLAPGAHTSFDVAYTPTTAPRDVAALVVEGTEDGVTITRVVALEGHTTTDGRTREVYPAATADAVDAVFLVLDSACHTQEHRALAANAGVFLSVADALAVDYAIATTTLDLDRGAAEGRFLPVNDRPTIVTPASVDPAGELAMTFAFAGNGSPVAQGFEAAIRALTGEHARGHNAGFLRDDAALALVYVVDREDDAALDRAMFVDHLRSLKGPAGHRRVRVSSISGGALGCMGPLGASYTSASYVEMARDTGGVDVSICAADWADVLQQVGLATFGLAGRYVLASDATLSSIRVFVGGVELPAGGPGAPWTYDVASRAVTLSPLVVTGEEVAVDYAPLCR